MFANGSSISPCLAHAFQATADALTQLTTTIAASLDENMPPLMTSWLLLSLIVLASIPTAVLSTTCWIVVLLNAMNFHGFLVPH